MKKITSLIKGKEWLLLLFLLLISIAVAFRIWFFNFGLLTNGDWTSFFDTTAVTLRINYFSLWLSDGAFGRVLIDLGQAPTYSLYGVFTKYLSLSFAVNERLINFWPAIIINLFGSYLLLNKLFPGNKIGVVCGMYVYALNTSFLDLYTGDVTLGTAFAFTPLLIFLLDKVLERGLIVDIVIFAIASSIMTAYEPRSFYITSISLFIYFIFKKLNIKKIKLKEVFLSASLFCLINFYWIFGIYKVGSLNQNVIYDRSLFGDEFWKLSYSLTLHHPWWSGAAIKVFENQQIPIYFWVTPILCTLSLVLLRKDWRISCFGAIAILGILLSKQSDYPFPHLYLWLYNNVPGFGAFREASKFYSLIALGYSVLIAGFVNYIWTRWDDSKIKIIGKYFITMCIAIIFLWNLKPFMNGEIGTLFVDRTTPVSYINFNNFIQSQEDYFRMYFFPGKSRWLAYTALHPQVDGSEALESNLKSLNIISDLMSSQQIESNIFKESFSKNIFDTASIKYVVIPTEDVIQDDNIFENFGRSTNPNIRSLFIDELDKIDWLTKISNDDNGLVYYENKTYDKPIFAFEDLVSFNSLQDLSEKYDFVTNKLDKEFYFESPNFKTDINVPKITISNPFENITQINFKKNTNLLEATSSLTINSSNELYENQSASNIYTHLSSTTLTVSEGLKGILSTNIETLTSPNLFTIATINTSSSEEYYAEIGTGLFELSNNYQNLGKIKEATTSIMYKTEKNIISNNSFESGLWQKQVGDCNRYNNNSNIGMELFENGGTDGKNYLELSATTHIACTSKKILIDEGNYVFSFDYKSPNASSAKFEINLSGATTTIISRYVPIGTTEWQHYSTKLTVPDGVNSAELAVFAISIDNKTKIINDYDNFKLERLNPLATIKLPLINKFEVQEIHNLSTSTIFKYSDSDYSYSNLIDNGSFENGLWNKNLEDCFNHDSNPIIGQKIDLSTSTEGNNSLELNAKNHFACTSKNIAVRGNAEYLISFDYQSPNAQSANYVISFNDAFKTRIEDSIPISSNGWEHFSRIVTSPPDATGITITLEARQAGGFVNVINRYDDVRVTSIPDLENTYYLVNNSITKINKPSSVTFNLMSATKKIVHVKGATTAFYLAFSESYHPKWILELNNSKIHGPLASWTPWVHPDKVPDYEHFSLDDFLNGWYVDVPTLCAVPNNGCTKNADGSYDIEMVIEFTPQRWFYVGLVISGTTLAGCIGYLVYDVVKRRKIKKAKSLNNSE